MSENKIVKLAFDCEHCKASILTENDIIDIREDEEVIKNNEEIKKHNIEVEKNIELQKIELRMFGERLQKLADKKNSGIFSRHNYELEIQDDCISIHTGKDWYVFSDEEAKNFISQSGLYVAKTKEGKRKAYISISVNKKRLIEHRYVLCPLCQGKNFIPLNNSKLEIDHLNYY